MYDWQARLLYDLQEGQIHLIVNDSELFRAVRDHGLEIEHL
jgi:hypothetical protein